MRGSRWMLQGGQYSATLSGNDESTRGRLLDLRQRACCHFLATGGRSWAAQRGPTAYRLVSAPCPLFLISGRGFRLPALVQWTRNVKTSEDSHRMSGWRKRDRHKALPRTLCRARAALRRGCRQDSPRMDSREVALFYLLAADRFVDVFASLCFGRRVERKEKDGDSQPSVSRVHEGPVRFCFSLSTSIGECRSSVTG